VAQVWSLKRFRILVFIVCVAGMTQGLLIPLITTLLDEKGISPGLNGMSAAMLYVGMLIASPLSAWIVARIGIKWTIVFGLVLVGVATSLFPAFNGVWLWSLLRLVVGIGDSFLHYATQLWITTTAPEKEKGSRISEYGFAYGLGFGVGPLGLNLLSFGEFVPFFAVLAILLLSLGLSVRLDEGKWEAAGKKQQDRNKLRRIYRIGLVGLCPAILYGFLESALSGNFPVIGLREGISKSWISVLISAFVWGSLLFQVPLGMLGDRIGRKNLLILVCSFGACGMSLIPLFGANEVYLLIAFALIGGLVGSLFSLGLAYVTDLLPARDLPAANAVAAVHFSVGSILGPYLGGLLIERFGGHVLFWFIGGSLFAYVLLACVYREAVETEKIEKRSKRAV
jgi:MFS family permease